MDAEEGCLGREGAGSKPQLDTGRMGGRACQVWQLRETTGAAGGDVDTGASRGRQSEEAETRWLQKCAEKWF